jgi:hypothetical protein
MIINIITRYVYRIKHTIIDSLPFLVVALVVTFIWFHDGLLLARGELGLNFYNYGRLLKVFRYTWIETSDTGSPISLVLVTIPLNTLMSLFEMLSHAPVFEQATLVFFLLFLMGFSMYYLTKSSIKSSIRRSAGIIAGLFYMLNPYAIFCIWHRASFGLWFILPVLPMVLGLFLNGIESKKPIRYVLLINFVLLLFSTTFMNPGFIIVVWFLPFSASFIFLCQRQKKKLVRNIYRVLKFFGITFSLWVLLNGWWLLPLIFNVSEVSAFFEPADNIKMFIHLSESYPILNMFQLMHESYFSWRPIYSTAFFRFLGISIPFFAFTAMLFKPRNKFVLFFSCLALFGIFVTKGTQPPLGNLTLWVFKNVHFLQVFKNPFEKLGVITALSYAFLFGVALSSLHYHLQKMLRTSQFLPKVFRTDLFSTILRNILLFLILGLFMFPMWTGEVFTEEGGQISNAWVNIPWYVEIPSYYESADNWLSEQNDVFRIVGLPMSNTRNVQYDWSSGYFGMNPWNLYSKTMITTRSDITYIDNIIRILEDQLSDSNQLWRLLGVLNAKYIAVHKESTYPSAISHITRSPENVTRFLTGNFSTPNFDNPTQLTNCESTTFWKSYAMAPTADIILDYGNSSVKEGKASIKVNTVVTQGGWEGGIMFDPPERLDLSKYYYLTFWVKTGSLSNVRNIVFRIWDSNGIWRGWDITDLIGEVWTKVYINLNKNFQPDLKGRDNMSDIDFISFGVHSEEKESASIEWWFDNAELVPSKYVNGQEYIYYIKTFGKLDFYKVDDEYFIPRIYATNQFAFTSNIQNAAVDYARSRIDPRDCILFLESQSSINNKTFLNALKTEKLYKPEIEFQQVNPTRYEVQIENATQPFFVILSATYHDKWRANINGIHIPDEKHFITNGYANAWYINKTGSYQIVLEYEPQKLFTDGLIISITSFVICIVYLVTDLIRNWAKIRARIKIHSIF